MQCVLCNKREILEYWNRNSLAKARNRRTRNNWNVTCCTLYYTLCFSLRDWVRERVLSERVSKHRLRAWEHGESCIPSIVHASYSVHSTQVSCYYSTLPCYHLHHHHHPMVHYTLWTWTQDTRDTEREREWVLCVLSYYKWIFLFFLFFALVLCNASFKIQGNHLCL